MIHSELEKFKSRGVDVHLALNSLKGRLSLYDRLITVFKQKASLIAAEIDTKLTKQDKTGLLIQVHSLAVNASTLGAKKFFDYCRQLEAGLRNPEYVVDQQTFSDLQLEVDALIAILDEISQLISVADNDEKIITYSAGKTVSDGNLLLEGLRVLSVDDQSINQDVIGMILQRQGAEVSYCHNGSQAIEYLKNNAEKVDVVLMDVQMPVLDGKKASQKIREDIASAETLPIIAISAFSSVDNQQSCIQAGMNDFLPKPVMAEQLITTLQRWWKQKPQNIQPQEAPPLEDIEDDVIANIDLLSGLQSLGEPALLKSMLQRLLASIRDVLWHLPRFKESNDFYAAEQRLHALKGVSGNLRVMPVFDITSRLYSIIQRHKWPSDADLQQLADLIKHLDDSWEEIVNTLDKMTSKTAETLPNDTDQEYGKFLPQIYSLLKAHDLSVGPLLQTLQSSAKGKIKTLLSEILDLVMDLQFEKAVEKIKSLPEIPVSELAAMTLDVPEQNQKVLIVDDEAPNIFVMANLFDENFQLFAAINGDEALKLARQQLPDVVLLDIRMPEMDGYEVCRQLKSDPKTRNIPIIFVSNLSDDEDEIDGLIMGASDYLRKPIIPELVRTRVHTQLKLVETRKALTEKNQLLQESLRIQEDMESLMRHDLKGPVGAILGFLDLTLSRGQIDEKSTEWLGFARSASHRALNMIELSMDLVRMEHGSYELDPVKLDVIDVINKVEKEKRKQLSHKNIRLALHPADDNQVWGEETLIHSMFSNLCGNAIEASPENAIIDIYFNGKSSDHLDITIRNQGEVPLEIRNRFFEKYATSGKHLGTGLGTYSARLMAQIHKGDLNLVTSEKGYTSLVVTLPRNELR